MAWANFWRASPAWTASVERVSDGGPTDDALEVRVPVAAGAVPLATEPLAVEGGSSFGNAASGG